MNKDDLLRQAVKRMALAVDADRDNREEAHDDMQNLAGRQWPEETKSAREAEGRPCLTINRLPQFARQVTGDIRNMNPSINILPGDDDATDDVAELLEGLVRHIQYRSDASSVYEGAAEQAAQCGMGHFRIRTDYEDDRSFNQEILIERIHNPFSVYTDPAAKLPTREDAEWRFILESMSADDFREQYPNKLAVSVDTDDLTGGLEHWCEGDDVMVAEYFWREAKETTLGLLADGSVVENPVAPMNVIRKRKVITHRVMWAKISGKDILEGPQEIPCSKIPVISVVGEELHIGPEVVRTSVIRFAKDPQRLYNYWRSAQTELVALQPKAPYLVTPKQVSGFETFWNEANDTNRPYLPYNPDEKAPAPSRVPPPIPSQGMMQEVMTAAEDMKGTTGVYDAALGNRSNENSGVAIRQRQMESDVSTSIYSDNMAKAIQCAGKIIVEMIPAIYDTQRMVRTIAKDDSQQVVPVNAMAITQDGPQVMNDLTRGKYNVRVDVGPNYATKRQETAESMIDFVRAFPQAAPIVGDLIATNMDWPGADQFAERLKKALPPGFRDPEDLSPEEQQQQAQAMQQQAKVQQFQDAMQRLELAKNTAEAEEAMADVEKTRLEVADASLELALKNGQLDAAISAIVQEQVARALQGAFAAQAPQGYPPAY